MRTKMREKSWKTHPVKTEVFNKYEMSNGELSYRIIRGLGYIAAGIIIPIVFITSAILIGTALIGPKKTKSESLGKRYKGLFK